MNQISAFGIHFDEDDLIRKQREEIILLTKELRNHDELIEKYESTTNKLKQSLKKMEKEKQEFSCKVVSLNAELNQIKNELKKSNDEKKALETKLTQKDAYIQTQSKKIHELSTNYEKCQLELSNLGKLNEELKNTNSKLKLTSREQSNRILELKSKLNELLKVLESKNELVKLSSSQIQNLELNLNKSVELINHLKLKSNKNQIEKNAISQVNYNTDEPEKTEIKTNVAKSNQEPDSMWSLESNTNSNNKATENAALPVEQKTTSASNCSTNSVQVELEKDSNKTYKTEKSLNWTDDYFSNKQAKTKEQTRMLTSTPTNLFNLKSLFFSDKRAIDV